jgi:hypothetical protein
MAADLFQMLQSGPHLFKKLRHRVGRHLHSTERSQMEERMMGRKEWRRGEEMELKSTDKGKSRLEQVSRSKIDRG